MPPTVVRLRVEAGLDRREPLIREFIEADIAIFFALQSLRFGAEFHQPPLGDREVVRLEREPDLLAVDLDEGAVMSISVPVEATATLLKHPRFLRHASRAKVYRDI